MTPGMSSVAMACRLASIRVWLYFSVILTRQRHDRGIGYLPLCDARTESMPQIVPAALHASGLLCILPCNHTLSFPHLGHRICLPSMCRISLGGIL
jgi:hypothetical protein